MRATVLAHTPVTVTTTILLMLLGCHPVMRPGHLIVAAVTGAETATATPAAATLDDHGGTAWPRPPWSERSVARTDCSDLTNYFGPCDNQQAGLQKDGNSHDLTSCCTACCNDANCHVCQFQNCSE